VVSCQDEKSQHKNKAKAMKILAARLYDQMKTEREQEISAQRRDMVGSGDRSAKIRTYNFPQGRITDHRIGLTLYNLTAVMEGDLDEVIEALVRSDLEQSLARESA
jgi:peptide chain release factor 1